MMGRGEATLNCRSGEAELFVGMLRPYDGYCAWGGKNENLPGLTLVMSGSNTEPDLRNNMRDFNFNTESKHTGYLRNLTYAPAHVMSGSIMEPDLRTDSGVGVDPLL